MGVLDMTGVNIKRVDFDTREDYVKAYQKAYRQQNKEKSREYAKAYHKSHYIYDYEKSRGVYLKHREKRLEYNSKPQNKERSRSWQLANRYGLTIEKYDHILEVQDYKCAICKTDNPGGKNWHVDHDHQDGSVRGLLCNNCNGGLGFFKDDPRNLIRAYEYLLISVY